MQISRSTITRKPWLMPVALLITTGISTVIAIASYRIVRELMLQKLQRLALLQVERQAEQIDQWLNQHMATVQTIAATPTVRTLNWQKIQPYFDQEVARSRDFSSLTFAYPNGTYYNSYIGGRVNTQRGNIADRPYFKKVLAGEANISDPFISRSMGVTTIAVATPIWENSYRSKAPIGEIHAQVSIDLITKMVRQAQYGEGSYVLLLNSKGEPILQPNVTQSTTLEKPFPSLKQHSNIKLRQLTQKMLSGEKGIKQLQLQGQQKYLAYVPLRAVPWAIAIAIPATTLEAPLAALNVLAGLLAFLPIISVLATWRQLRLLNQAEQQVRWLQTQESSLKRLNRALQNRTKALQSTLTYLQQAQSHLIQQQRLANLGRLLGGIAQNFQQPVRQIQQEVQQGEFAIQQLQIAVTQLASERLKQQSPIAQRATKQATKAMQQLQQSFGQVAGNLDRFSAFTLALKMLKTSPEQDRINLNQTLDEVVQLLDHRLAKQDYRPEIQVRRYYETLPRFLGADSAMQQIFINLLNNAIDAIEYRFAQGAPIQRPFIRLRTQYLPPQNGQRGRVLLRITDNGCGILPEHQAALFTPFFTTKPKTQYSGLGLFICHSIVQQYQGTIRCISTPTRGTDILIELPIVQTGGAITIALSPPERLPLMPPAIGENGHTQISQPLINSRLSDWI